MCAALYGSKAAIGSYAQACTKVCSDLVKGLHEVSPNVLHTLQTAAESNQIVLDAILCTLLWTLQHDK